jgi:hypothetical protein
MARIPYDPGWKYRQGWALNLIIVSMASAFESERRQVKVVSIAGFRNNISRSV